MRVVLLLFPFYSETNLKVIKVNWYIQSRMGSGTARRGVKCLWLQDSGLTCSASNRLSALTAAPSPPILKSFISRVCTSSTQHSFMDEKTEILKAEWWSVLQRWGHQQNRGWMPSPSSHLGMMSTCSRHSRVFPSSWNSVFPDSIMVNALISLKRPALTLLFKIQICNLTPTPAFLILPTW